EFPISSDAPTAEQQRLRTERQRRLVQYHLLLAQGRERQGRSAEALSEYQTLRTLMNPGERLPHPQDPGLQVRSNLWLDQHVAALLAKAAPDQKVQLQEQLAREWAEVRGATVAEWKRFVLKASGLTHLPETVREELIHRLSEVSATRDALA